jgi:hypothetical protein
MSLFQLYEANKEKYKLLKSGSILRFKGIPSFKIRINNTNWENEFSNVVCRTPNSFFESVNIDNSYILSSYELCEDTLE